ncbi:hypothetical protein JG688_00016916 [Phytophthora aleatoria]|uniref:Uncharacterized protein n=1 Tax=Phytophthora aleatoria TaxID=2496075 RepID=A0A8J5MCJ4_9STRA|nr:hypothetical protein JG688_00016916 [Phytophthora aleatoria]
MRQVIYFGLSFTTPVNSLYRQFIANRRTTTLVNVIKCTCSVMIINQLIDKKYKKLKLSAAF